MSNNCKNYICITAAVKEELSEIKGCLKSRKVLKVDRTTIYRGELSGKKILLVLTGVGKGKAGEAVRAVIKNFDLKYIIAIGFCGAIDERLKIADIVIGSTVIDDATKVEYNTDPYLRETLKKLLSEDKTSFTEGGILSSDNIIGSPALKKRKRDESHAVAVEMENSAIIREAVLNNIPFIPIRAVSDTADDDISFLEGDTSFIKLRLAFHAVTHPDILPKLQKLKKNSQHAARSLRSAILRLCEVI